MITRLDTFNTYATADLSKRWSIATGIPQIQSGGRFTGNRLRLGNTTTVALLNQFDATLRGFGVNYQNRSSGVTDRFAFMDASSIQVEFRITSTTIEAFRGGTVSIGSASFERMTNNWYYLESEVSISSTVGTVKVWIDNVLVLNLSGVNNQATGNPTTDGWQAFGSSAGEQCWLDELYITDDQGSVNVGRLGPKRILSAILNGDGTTTDWTPSSAVSHYTLVDETAINESDFVETDVVNEVELFTKAALSGVTITAVHGIQLAAYANEQGLTPREIQLAIRTGGANFNSTSRPLLSSFQYVFGIWDVNPDTTAAWSESEINAAEVGMELTT